MDIPRPNLLKAQRRKRILYAGLAALGLTVLVSIFRLQSRAPSVERNLVWIDVVKRGQMLRQIRGLGTLVPEEIRWVAARTQGRVDKIILRPGAVVSTGSAILQLSNPDLAQAVANADSQLKAAEAEYRNLEVTLQSGVLQSEAVAINAKADYEQSKLRNEVNEQLFQEGLLSDLERRLSKVTADQASSRYAIEQKRFTFAQEAIPSQLAIKQAEVDRLRAQSKLRHDELEALTVRADMDGVLQLLPIEVGAQVQPGTNLARVADPTRLKAEIRIPETLAKDVQIGQPAAVDTRNGIVAGKVSRLDPSVQNGTVTVDIVFTAPLPKGARPDLSIDGTIELERLSDVLLVKRPVFSQEQALISLFRIEPNDSYASRIPVQLGRTSVDTVEIISGLAPGEKVILSDMSQWESADRIKLY